MIKLLVFHKVVRTLQIIIHFTNYSLSNFFLLMKPLCELIIMVLLIHRLNDGCCFENGQKKVGSSSRICSF